MYNRYLYIQYTPERRAEDPDPEPHVFGPLKPEPLEKKNRSRSHSKKNSEDGDIYYYSLGKIVSFTG